MFTFLPKKDYAMYIIMLIRLFIVLILALLSMCGNKINNSDAAYYSTIDTLSADFGFIIKAYKSAGNIVRDEPYSHKKELLSFDFSKLTESGEVKDKDNRFEVFYSKTGIVLKIIKYDNRFMDLEFSVVQMNDFTIFVVNNHENGARYGGFVFSYKGKLYYLNSSKATDSFFWEADSDYSTLMELDSRLEVKFIYKFYKGRLLYKSSVTYNNRGELDEEYYNVCREVIRINKNTLLTKFQESADKQQSFLYVAKSKYMVEGNQILNQPLWTYEGEHTGILTN